MRGCVRRKARKHANTASASNPGDLSRLLRVSLRLWRYVEMHVSACVCVCVCVCARVRACVYVCVCVCLSACVCVCQVLCCCVTVVSRTNSKLCRAQRPARRCTLMSRGHGRSLRCAVQLSSMMGHGQRTSGTNGRGRDTPPASLPPPLRRGGSPLISSWCCLP